MPKSIRVAMAVVGTLVLASCAAPKDFDTGGAIRAVQASASDLAKPKSVFFATTRCTDAPASGAPGSKEELLSKRCWEPALNEAEVLRLGFGMAENGKVTCGSATVAVMPPDADEKSATTVTTPVTFDCGTNFATLRQSILNTPCRCALIFVHGFNTSFAFGVKRMAQLALDLKFEGVPILFSFSAAARFNDYVNDTEAAELAAPALSQLLADLSRNDGAGTPTIDLIAHSMGARVALRAITEGEAPALRYVVLAAPDIDTTAFLQLAQKAVPQVKRLTVYTSRFDVAMSASTSIHGARPRVGEGLSASVAKDLARTEIVDATERATDPYAHSYFAESKVMLDDMRGALAGKPAAERKPLICNSSGPNGVVACKMPCPDGAKCGPDWYARLVHWLLD
ncbi:MAG: alpha/beta fold hydrolase [Alphaproteobacteria bacterium]|nr:alpha/beta fold hydrolase [Alphaproteobacteria bacterium]